MKNTNLRLLGRLLPRFDFGQILLGQILACTAWILLCGAIARAQKQTPASAQTAVQRTDAEIEADVMHALDSSDLAKSDVITPATAQGEVTLSGTVESEAARELAEEIAQHVAGVTAVHNNLKVGNPNAPQAAEAPAEMPPPPVVFQNQMPSDQLGFLKDYAGKMESQLQKDKRFRTLMKQVTPRTQYFYSDNMPLSEASGDVLAVDPLQVEVRDERYVMAGTRGGGFRGGRGFVWFDTKDGIGVGGIFFHPVDGEPTPVLAIFSRQLKDTTLSMSQLPQAFAQDLSQWEMEASVPAITTRYFIPEDGKEYLLLHDEEYCDHAENAPAPPENVCAQMDADAAEIDLNAADFVTQSGHGLAWMLSPPEVEFIAARNKRCGTGPGLWRCRARLTRQRVRLVVVRQRR